MRRRPPARAVGLALIAAGLVLPATALGVDAATEARLDRIERQLESRGLVDMLRQLQQLQRDVQQLRGELEVQAHQTEDMQRRQRELYLDIDRRLQQLETGQAAQPSLAPSSAPGTAGTGGMMQQPPLTPSAPSTAAGSGTGAGAGPGMRPGAAPGVVSAAEQAEYDKALAVLRDGRYDDAAAAFNRFLAQHPNSGLADNATYWLGETYYVTRDFDQALATFSKLVEFQPQSPKVPDARLKIGYIHYEKQDWAAARQELTTLVSNYPGTTAARLAKDRLQRMQKEGH